MVGHVGQVGGGRDVVVVVVVARDRLGDVVELCVAVADGTVGVGVAESRGGRKNRQVHKVCVWLGILVAGTFTGQGVGCSLRTSALHHYLQDTTEIRCSAAGKMQSISRRTSR